MDVSDLYNSSKPKRLALCTTFREQGAPAWPRAPWGLPPLPAHRTLQVKPKAGDCTVPAERLPGPPCWGSSPPRPPMLPPALLSYALRPSLEGSGLPTCPRAPTISPACPPRSSDPCWRVWCWVTGVGAGFQTPGPLLSDAAPVRGRASAPIQHRLRQRWDGKCRCYVCDSFRPRIYILAGPFRPAGPPLPRTGCLCPLQVHMVRPSPPRRWC